MSFIQELKAALLPHLRDLIPEYLPGGKLVGNEWWCSDIHGGDGKSLKFNIVKDVFADFSTDGVSGDLITVHSLQHGCSMADAARDIAKRIGFGNGHHPPAAKPKRKVDESSHIAPPVGIGPPAMEHFKHGKPSAHWVYRSDTGTPMFYVARYDLEDGKQIIPWTWSHERKAWTAKAWKAPRPLYGLDDLAAKPDKPVLIVEGEKAADAAREICGNVYAVVTWQGGSKALSKSDFAPLYTRRILIWPDADKPGLEAAYEIAAVLTPHCPEVKLIRPYNEEEAPHIGWDAADALSEGWDWARFRAWAADRIEIRGVTLPPLNLMPVQPTKPPVTVNVQINEAPASDEPEATRSIYALWEDCGVQISRGGKPTQNLDNVMRVLSARADFKQILWFDEFYMKRLTTFGGTPVRPWNRHDDRVVWLWLQRDLGFTALTEETVRAAIWVFAMRDRRCDPKDWMESLTWDGMHRIETFFTRAMGAVDSPYARAVSKNWWLTLAARIFSPGCKVDNMVVLEGDQGKGKSTALDIIGGKWYVDCGEPVQNKDFYLTLRGHLVIEISELDSFIRSEATTVKSAVTRRTDVFRPPYGEDAESFPRRCVFVGTTNEETYLSDHTGARRFWPVKTNEIDLAMIAREREQCFAESAALFKQGASWFGVPAEAIEEQENRRQADEWEGEVQEWIRFKYEVTLTEVARDCLKIDVAKFDRSTQFRLGRVLRAIGWKKKNKRLGSGVSKSWYPKDKIQEMLPFTVSREPGEEG